MCAFLDGGRVFAVLALFRSFRRLKQNSRLQAVVAPRARRGSQEVSSPDGCSRVGHRFRDTSSGWFFSFPAWPS